MSTQLKSDTPNPSVSLLGMDRSMLETYFLSIGEKKFRAQQWMKWVYHEGLLQPQEMTNLSLKLRQHLQTQTHCEMLPLVEEQVSADGTIKWLLSAGTNNAIETVFIPEQNRGTLCISSQVGCALDCTFCATARQGFNRNLTTAEIIGQLWFARDRLKALYGTEKSVTNVVMMGMGEPLANFTQVVPALRIMLDDFGFGLSKRRVTVSTSGIVPKINALCEAVDVSLAVSLHAPTDAIRDQLVPLNRKYPLDQLLAACKRYLQARERKDSITFEYVMLDQINDQPEHAYQLLDLLKNISAKVNLIPFNQFEGSGWRRSPQSSIDRFFEILAANEMRVTMRRPRGEDIQAACGQLAGQVKDRAHRDQHYVRLYKQEKLKRKISIACV